MDSQAITGTTPINRTYLWHMHAASTLQGLIINTRFTAGDDDLKNDSMIERLARIAAVCANVMMKQADANTAELIIAGVWKAGSEHEKQLVAARGAAGQAGPGGMAQQGR